jgi:L-arabinokinase
MIDETAVSIRGSEAGPTAHVEAFLRACEACWPAGQQKPSIVTRAPGRLDCMGGMADYSGALALQIPTDRGVFVAAAKRDDERFHIASIGWQNGGQPAVVDWPLSIFHQSDGQVVESESFRANFTDHPWACHVAGVFFALLDLGDVPHFGGGVTMVMQSDIPADAGLASSAAIQVATARALAELFDVDMPVQAIAAACRTANREVVCAEPGLVDHLTCLQGEPDALLQIRCQPDEVRGTLPLPADVTFAAIDAGFRLPIYRERCAYNRACSTIGKYLIDRILLNAGNSDDPTGGYLANISPNEYVRRFRNELPVKIRGRELEAWYGVPDNLDFEIEPNQVYKVRSRTEHHIYENDRTYRFMERLARVCRTGERDALVEAGELMYASHWSYGQRCGMGSIETDVLVNLIREQGPSKGLFGAKVTGGGCGGSVAVLMARNPAATQTLQSICGAYAQRTGKTPTMLTGSSPGAIHFHH